MQHEKSLTFGSLFAGIGGLDLGFERAGLECKWQVEIDEYCRRVLAKNWPDVQRHDDVCTWPTAGAQRVDVIAGGFPCQDISYAGKGAGLAGERSGLFYELIRVVREMGPRFVVLENVSALLTRGIGEVLGTLASIGFDAEWNCIPAAALGAPHIRDRLFVIGERNTDSNGNRRQAWSGVIGGEEGSGREYRCNTERLRSPFPHSVQLRLQGSVCGSVSRRAEVSEQSLRSDRGDSGGDHWETEPDVGRVAHGVPKRVDRIRGLGNAVVPQVGEYIANAIVHYA